LNFKLSH